MFLILYAYGTRVYLHSSSLCFVFVLIIHSVTTKNPKSTFRLASEMTGIEGMIECSTWEKVNCIFSLLLVTLEQKLVEYHHMSLRAI